MAGRTCRSCTRRLNTTGILTHGLCGLCYAAVPLAVPLAGEPPLYAKLTELTVERLRQKSRAMRTTMVSVEVLRG